MSCRFLESLNRGRSEWRGCDRNVVSTAAVLLAPRPDDAAPPVAVAVDEVLLRVGFYHQSKKPPRLQQEFIVLGSQRLTDLRDRIYCLKDSVVSGEHKGLE